MNVGGQEWKQQGAVLMNQSLGKNKSLDLWHLTISVV